MEYNDLQVGDRVVMSSYKTPITALAEVVHACFDGILLRDLTVFPGDRHLIWATDEIEEIDPSDDSEVVAKVYVG